VYARSRVEVSVGAHYAEARAYAHTRVVNSSSKTKFYKDS
jgi:hypothetical protein